MVKSKGTQPKSSKKLVLNVEHQEFGQSLVLSYGMGHEMAKNEEARRCQGVYSPLDDRTRLTTSCSR